MGAISKLLGNSSAKEVKRLNPIVDKIVAYKPVMESLTPEQMEEKTQELRQRAQQGESLDALLPEAYALVRESTRRVLGTEHYPVQLLGGIVLHQGRIAEMKTGEGKEFSVETKVPTLNGWMRAGDIKVGTVVFDRRGLPTTIMGVFPQGKKRVYELKLRDGRVIRCGAEHQWAVYSSANAKLRKTVTTQTMYQAIQSGKSAVYHLPVAQAVQYPEAQLPMDPYLLGVFLGCGRKNNSNWLVIGSTDDWLPKKMEQLLGVTAIKQNGEKYIWNLYGQNGKKYRVQGEDAEIKFLLTDSYEHEKYIPSAYKTASVSQRWELLRGLMDASGSMGENGRGVPSPQFPTTSVRMKNDVMELLYSLGISCSVRRMGTKTEKNPDKKQYIIYTHMANRDKAKCFHQESKRQAAEQLADVPDKKDYSRIAIREIRLTDEYDEQVCFTVNNDEHLFLIGSYVVTHNTQTCFLPAYLNALKGEGVQIVTVNDYLAKRDADMAREVLAPLGMQVGCVLNDMNTEQRQQEYGCDITYITNNELGFDYLRDNMATSKNQKVQRKLDFSIVDEVDSVLIDEARTPLIISGQAQRSTKLYEAADLLVRQMKKGTAKAVSKMDYMMGDAGEETGDFVVEEKEKRVTLTEEGIRKAEAFFHIENLSAPENIEIQHHVNLALRAHNLMFRDQQYVVTEAGEVLIVDEFTGRIMPGRRYSDGLHQAIEAKEHVKINTESKTLATITFQNFFNKYRKKSGMTGTAKTEENEFQEIYQMDVVEIPTNRPVIREDQEDRVYKTLKEKFEAVVDEIVKAHEKGQPVLVGTVTIENSERLSSLLRKRGIPHNVLNAKYHEIEANIIAEAGKHGAVTIATNMAGRGTDIKLDEEARKAGGLKVIGTERHEARRIDNQLRGRSGRQGDPGESVFYVSLEDDLIKLFGADRLLQTFQSLGVEDGEELQHKFLSKAILRAQEKVENNNFEIRRRLLGFDSVMNEQREIIYAERERVLNGESMHDSILEMLDGITDKMVSLVVPENGQQSPEDWDIIGFNRIFEDITGSQQFICLEGTSVHEAMEKGIKAMSPEMAEMLIPPLVLQTGKKYGKEQFCKDIREYARILYQNKCDSFPSAFVVEQLERQVLLRAMDSHWMNHIDDMEILREGIGLAAYGQKDPQVEYRIQGYNMFGEMVSGIQEDVIKTLFHLQPMAQPGTQEQPPKPPRFKIALMPTRPPKEAQNG